MSEFVTILREEQRVPKHDDITKMVLREAADRIEALEAEVERLRVDVRAYHEGQLEIQEVQRERDEARARTPEQATRTAWRIVRDWLRAQLAMIEAKVVTLAQVMLPYAVTDSGATVYERLEASGPGLLRLTNGTT